MFGGPAYGYSLERPVFTFPDVPRPSEIARFVPVPIVTPGPSPFVPIIVMPPPPATTAPEPVVIIPSAGGHSWQPGQEAQAGAGDWTNANDGNVPGAQTGGDANVAPGQTPIFYSDPITGSTSPTPLPGYAPIY